MLERAAQQNVIHQFQDIFQYCTEEEITMVTEIPYFEGDFWPNVIEETIKELDEEEEERKACEASGNVRRGRERELFYNVDLFFNPFTATTCWIKEGW